MHAKKRLSSLTEHVALVILTAALISNMCLDSEPDHCQVLNSEITGIDPTNDAKSSSIVNFSSDIPELASESGQREVLAGDGITIELESCNSYQHKCEKPRGPEMTIPLKATRADRSSTRSPSLNWQTKSSACLKSAPVQASG